MSKHNYTQYSNKKTNTHNAKSDIATEVKAETEVDTIPTEAIEPVETVEKVAEPVVMPETVEGVVTNCAKLNVRAEPDATAKIVCVLDAMSEIQIDVAQATDEWLKIYTTTGVEGYCMRKFVDARL